MQNYPLFYKGGFLKGSFFFSERTKPTFCSISGKNQGKDVDLKPAWNRNYSHQNEKDISNQQWKW